MIMIMIFNIAKKSPFPIALNLNEFEFEAVLTLISTNKVESKQ